MGRCEPRANENDPGLITLPEGIDELSDAVEQEFDDFLATILPVELLPQDYIRDVVLGSDHMEPQELKLYG